MAPPQRGCFGRMVLRFDREGRVEHEMADIIWRGPYVGAFHRRPGRIAAARAGSAA